MVQDIGAAEAQFERVFPLRPASTEPRYAPADRRVHEVRNPDSLTVPPSYQSLDEWLARADGLRRHILVSAGLWPLPDRTPLNTSIFGKTEHAEYSVEKVHFESRPGFLVTGNIYRPLGRTGPFPAILIPHGHWDGGRLQHDATCSVPACGISLARQGYVAFTHDMVGYLDSTQVPHTFGGPREELWGISLLGLQLWNSVRALDFLCTLPDVDPAHLGCMGASGGATQTFMLTAVDERIAAAAPMVMVSTHFQGGCLCENAPNLRLDASNVEFAALAAPRPLLLVSATGDWTSSTPKVEYPAVKAIYRLFAADDRVENVHVEAGHNCNRESRESAYAFFGRWLPGMSPGTDLRELPLEVDSDRDLRVFPGPTRRDGSLDQGVLTDQLVQEATGLLRHYWPRSVSELARFRAVFGPALSHSLAARWPASVTIDTMGTNIRGGVRTDRLLLGRANAGDQIPAILFRPTTGDHVGAVLMAHGEGKAALAGGSRGESGTMIQELVGAGHTVLALDVFLTGEYNTLAGRSGRDQSGLFFTTYNRTDTAQRVQDILTGLMYLDGVTAGGPVALAGVGEAGLWSLIARALAPVQIPLVADASQFAVDDDASYMQRLFVPGLLRAGGLRTALALSAPAATFIHNTAQAFTTGAEAALYRMFDRPNALRVRESMAASTDITTWLRRRLGEDPEQRPAKPAEPTGGSLPPYRSR